MIDLTEVPTFEELATSIADQFSTLLLPYEQWADLARRAIKGVPYDVQRLAMLEAFINTTRAELRKMVLVASEHLEEDQLDLLRSRAHMSKKAWKSLKNSRPVNIKYGFSLISF